MNDRCALQYRQINALPTAIATFCRIFTFVRAAAYSSSPAIAADISSIEATPG